MLGKTPQGFTLMEFLVALSVVVIIAGLSFPLFSTLSKKHRVSAAAEDLYSFLQYARTEALKRNANIYVSFATGSNWCYGAKQGSACSCGTVNDCPLGTRAAGSATQSTLSTTGMTSNSIYFDSSRGAASNTSTATFTVYGQSELVRLNINRLGTVTLCSTGISGYTAC